MPGDVDFCILGIIFGRDNGMRGSTSDFPEEFSDSRGKINFLLGSACGVRFGYHTQEKVVVELRSIRFLECVGSWNSILDIRSSFQFADQLSDTRFHITFPVTETVLRVRRHLNSHEQLVFCKEFAWFEEIVPSAVVLAFNDFEGESGVLSEFFLHLPESRLSNVIRGVLLCDSGGNDGHLSLQVQLPSRRRLDLIEGNRILPIPLEEQTEEQI